MRSEYPHHIGAIDFLFDQTMDGHTPKFLNMVDEYSRVCLAIRVDRMGTAAATIDTLAAAAPLPA